MRPDVARDFDEGRRYLGHMKQIVARYLIAEAPPEEDQERNTDLIVLRLDTVRIACRVRKEHYLSSYGGEFTIRSSRPSGVKTELAKVVEGWGDYALYGFGARNSDHLIAWALIDLNAFRLWFTSAGIRRGAPPGVEKPNGDGSSKFRAFRYTELPSHAVVASHNLPIPSRPIAA